MAFAIKRKATDFKAAQENYKGIPFGPATVHTWRGDIAQFIFENLSY